MLVNTIRSITFLSLDPDKQDYTAAERIVRSFQRTFPIDDILFRSGIIWEKVGKSRNSNKFLNALKFQGRCRLKF